MAERQSEGFETLPLSEGWEEMARDKRTELEEKKQQINSMIRILDDGLKCKCLNWSDCFTKQLIQRHISPNKHHWASFCANEAGI